ncbi:P-loop containing nucleoside triphosphate hydrolase protein [Xylaria digitata]|nr:P-loop containing nucleoside triphosphate hydrolase protein [Xylaria digitata]
MRKGNHSSKAKAPKQDGAESSTDSSSDSKSESTSESGTRVHESRKLEEKEKIGSRPEVLHLFAKKDSEGGKLSFSSLAPAQVRLYQKDNAEMTKDRNETFAIVVRHTFHGLTVDTNSIIIHNEWLKGTLSIILAGYPDLQLDAPSLSFSPPFAAFIHRWDQLLAREENEKDHEGKELLKTLREILSTELQDSFQALRDFRTTGYINFHHLQLAFDPSDIVIRSKGGILSAGILEKTWKVTNPFRSYVGLEIEVVDWDRNVQGLRGIRCYINAFEGLKKITELTAFPLKVHERQEKIQTELLERGKIFFSIRGRHMKFFQGRVKREKDQEWRKSKVDNTIYLSERIMVDAKAYHRFHKSAPSLSPFDGLQKSATNRLREAHLCYQSKDVKQLSLDEIRAMLTVPKVKGFALDSKSWHKFNIADISSFIWNQEAFDNLVLNETVKELLSAFVSSDRSDGEEFDDFVQGKGKGLILLLGGPPGVGKTLTAEGVAEKLQRPLYRVKAGDLGVSAEKVERSLKSALDLCAYWDAVLLIDEADVFLGRRSDEDLNRNELVSIFLVLLEYYQGVLILTTNRTEGLDPAFESRIDIALTYKELTRDARREISSHFVQRLSSSDIDLSEQDLDSLAQWPLNGRQIKSAMKTARILAVHQGMPLRMLHLATVIDIRRKGAQLLRTGAPRRKIQGPTAPNFELPTQQFWRLMLLGSLAALFPVLGVGIYKRVG